MDRDLYMSAPRKPKQEGMFTRLVKSVWANLTNVVDEPFTLSLIVIAGVIALTHGREGTNSVLTKLSSMLEQSNVAALQTLAKAINDHAGKLVGAIILSPAVLSMPSTWVLTGSVASLVYIALAPAHSIFTYVFVALQIRLAFRTKNRYAKVLVLISLVLAVYYFDVLKHDVIVQRGKRDIPGCASVCGANVNCLSCCQSDDLNCTSSFTKTVDVREMCRAFCSLRNIDGCYETCYGLNS